MTPPPLFEFPRLKRAVVVVREAHPRAYEPIQEVPQSDLTRLIELILAAAPKDHAEVANSLNLREATVLVHAYARRLSQDQHDTITEVLVRRPVARQLGQAWMIFRTQPDLQSLRIAMKRIGVAIEDQADELDDTTALLLRIWTAANPDKQLIEEVESANSDIETWCTSHLLGKLGVEIDGPLYHRLQGNALIYASSVLLERYEDTTVAAWFSYITENRFDSAAANYIQQLHEDSWSINVIERCVKKHGLPAADGAFWSQIDEAKRLAIQRLIAGRMIAEFFEDAVDPEGRFRFWQQYSDKLLSIAYPRNRERVLLLFRGFIVVEFRDIGNAGYVYPENLRKRIESLVLACGPHSSCKIPQLAIHRIIHSQQWQRNTQIALNRNLR